MDSLKFLLYTLGRIGLMIVSTALAAFVGFIAIPVLITMLPDSSIRNTLLEDTTRSAAAFAVFLITQLVVFIDDGKRHAAYEIWSSINITITLFFLVLVSFAPTIFRDTFEPHGKAEAFYKIAYFPFLCFENGLGMQFVTSVLCGVIASCVCFYVGYLLAFKHYAKVHPYIIGGEKRGEDKIRAMLEAARPEGEDPYYEAPDGEEPENMNLLND